MRWKSASMKTPRLKLIRLGKIYKRRDKISKVACDSVIQVSCQNSAVQGPLLMLLRKYRIWVPWLTDLDNQPSRHTGRSNHRGSTTILKQKKNRKMRQQLSRHHVSKKKSRLKPLMRVMKMARRQRLKMLQNKKVNRTRYPMTKITRRLITSKNRNYRQGSSYLR